MSSVAWWVTWWVINSDAYSEKDLQFNIITNCSFKKQNEILDCQRCTRLVETWVAAIATVFTVENRRKLAKWQKTNKWSTLIWLLLFPHDHNTFTTIISSCLICTPTSTHTKFPFLDTNKAVCEFSWSMTPTNQILTHIRVAFQKAFSLSFVCCLSFIWMIFLPITHLHPQFHPFQIHFSLNVTLADFYINILFILYLSYQFTFNHSPSVKTSTCENDDISWCNLFCYPLGLNSRLSPWKVPVPPRGVVASHFKIHWYTI